MAAILKPAGDATAGVQPVGVIAQYQADAIAGTTEAADLSTGVHPYDSGTILGTVPPGKAGLKLISGVVQRASLMLNSQAAGVVGNALVSTYSTANVDPTAPAGSQPADGLSQAPNRE